ncbi:hypothetical protein Pla123a_26110 [Posidoniimonas polymericola]|uniref:Uncharacterized protein n=1 Tax=Posidoniimonas polymericola TaxID=2528002 RepID=A0A5C5YLY6_9BACT|nr:hypothetical protein [Posidoniimonas polymericola]TWT75829.1 hypothetical protein Pla123a_26110 [Posidoniimonas polymericola]
MPHRQALIRRTIDTVRARVRFALAGETAARTTVALAVFLWGWLVIDRLLEPPVWARAIVFTVVAVWLVRWLWKHSLSALVTRLPDSVIASWVERRWPELGETLLTALGADENDPDPMHQQLVSAARERAEEVLLLHDEPQVVDTRRLRPWFWGATAAIVSAGAALALTPTGAGVYLRRLALSEELWPRQVVLRADAFVMREGRLVWRAPKDTPLELEVFADLTGGHIAPDTVEARLRRDDGGRSRRQLSSIGEATTGPDAHQAYRMKIDRLRQDLEIRLRGGDARLGPLLIEVAPRPTVTSVELEVTPPEYTGDRTYRHTADAIDRIPEGAAVVLHAVSNKPLKKVAATMTRGEGAELLGAQISHDAMSFSIAVPSLSEAGAIEITLLDQDGIDSQPPYRLPLRVEADAPPRVELTLQGVGRVITPDAVLPVRVAILDDYGVDDAALKLTARDRTLSFPLALGPSPDSLEAAPRVDLLALRSDPEQSLPRLEPGDRIQLQATARDHYQSASDPPAGPHESTSQSEAFAIVTAEDLVARLEEREVNLRRTFEQIYDEARSAELSADRLDLKQQDTTPEDAARQRRLGLSRLVEQFSKLTHDVASVAAGFGEIHNELVNNRIQNDDLKERIELRIVRPLEKIAAGGLPRLERDAKDAAASLGQRPDEPALPEQVREQLADVVAQMQGALNEMKAVETYNEVLALLRGIIDDQREISDKTGDARKASLKRLLLD